MCGFKIGSTKGHFGIKPICTTVYAKVIGVVGLSEHFAEDVDDLLWANFPLDRINQMRGTTIRNIQVAQLASGLKTLKLSLNLGFLLDNFI